MFRWYRHAAVAALMSTVMMTLPQTADARAQLIRQGPQNGCRDIALTFDTEFSATTQSLANLLDELNVKSTWFFLAEQVERNAAIVGQVAARHQIGNHTVTHPVMPQQTVARMHSEIAGADATIARVAGTSPRPLFRPPYGEWNNTMLDVAEAEGYPYAFLWSIDTRDWAGPSAEAIRQEVVRNARPGSIVLQHGSPANTVEATRLYVPDLRARGFQFVTLTELLGIDRDQRDFGGDTYVIQTGDSWAQIGSCHNVPGPRLAAYNGNPDTPPGYLIHIPHRDELVIELDGRRPELPVYARVLPPGRSVAPVRLAEQMGATVEWDGERVHVRKGELTMVITPGEQLALVNGEPADMGVAATWAEERVLIPVRFLAERLGYTVSWNADTWVASISTP